MIHLLSAPGLMTAATHPLRPRFRSHYYGHGSSHGGTWLDLVMFLIVVVVFIGVTFLRVSSRRRRAGSYGAPGPYGGPQAAAPGTGRFGSAAADPRFARGADPSVNLSEATPPASEPASPPPPAAAPNPTPAPAPEAGTAYQDPKYLGPGDWDGGPADPPEYRTPPG